MDLSGKTHWIFDLDGTLTVPMHDFAWLRDALGLADGEDILTTIASRPPERAEADRALLRSWEAGIAQRSRPQEDAMVLLAALRAKGCTMGILTRNTTEAALITLEAAGLAEWFPEEVVVSRETAPPKPHPGGVERLLSQWRVVPERAVMVGDWVYDAQSGRAAGCTAVLVMRYGPQPWADEAHVCVDSLEALVPLL